MIFRRIAVLAVLAVVLALVPVPGHSLGEAAGVVDGTTCTLGNETLLYDPAAFDWVASSTISCGAPYEELALSVSAVLVQATRNSLAIDGPGIICLRCPALQHRAFRGSQWMQAGIYQVVSTAIVYVPNRPAISGKHYSCFFVNGFEVKPLMAGCPKIN